MVMTMRHAGTHSWLLLRSVPRHAVLHTQAHPPVWRGGGGGGVRLKDNSEGPVFLYPVRRATASDKEETRHADF